MEKITLDVKPFQETLHQSMCGHASLKIVLSFYGVEKSEVELAKLSGKTDGGVDENGITLVAKSLGFKVYIKNESSYNDIEEWLKKGVPVIVNWFTRGRQDYSDSEVADGHYSVVAGLDDEYIYLQDPEIGGERKISRKDFLKVWFDFEGEYPEKDKFMIRQLIVVFR